MVETGAQIPSLELKDLGKVVGELDDSSSTCMPLFVVMSSSSDMCRALEPVFLQMARLNQGPYNVWFFVHGRASSVAAAYPKLLSVARVFPFSSTWEGLAALSIEKYPTAFLATRDNKVGEVVEGWDYGQWQDFLRRVGTYHPTWQLGVLPRKGLPQSGYVPVRSASVKSGAAS